MLDLHFFLRPVIGLSLVAATVAMHAAGATGVYKLAVQKWLPAIARPPRLWPVIWLIVRFTWLLIVLHMMEILLWGLFFFASGCMSDMESAMYFSGTTYATVGYGDVVLPRRWRLLGPVEGLTGILMCGLSTGFFFAIVWRLGSHATEQPPTS